MNRIDANGNVHVPPPDRAFLIFFARVHLREARARRNQRVSRDFYWLLLASAGKARRQALAMREPEQKPLFA